MKSVVYIFSLLLVLLCACTHGRYTAMRSGLDSMNERNRNDLPFAVSDVQPYADYFSQHGTPNDQMLAYYLLGRAYHEYGEAPMALENYQKAIECSDTTAADCDYKQLSRVYAQIAEIFYIQGLFRNQLLYEQLSIKAAWKARDTLAALQNYEQESYAYRKLGRIDSAISVIENVAKEYYQMGYPSDAAVSLGNIIDLLIDKGNYEKTKLYIDKYEQESGRFDSLGNIKHGCEIYYKVKGLYFLRTDVLDSAEFYFRKELRYGKDFNNQHAAAKGLVELYQKLSKPDSLTKYYQYAYDMADSITAQNVTRDIQRIQSMYDYTRQQNVAKQEREKAHRTSRHLLYSLVAFLGLFLFASWLYIARRKVVDNLNLSSSELTLVREELEELQQNALVNQQSIIDKENRIQQLERKLGKYGKLVFFGSEKAENDLLLSSRYRIIKSIAYKGLALEPNDWDNIYQLMKEYFPYCFDFLSSKLKIDTTEYQVCILLRLHFKAGEVANMLEVTPPYISKISTTALLHLFGKKGSSRDLSKELCKIS